MDLVVLYVMFIRVFTIPINIISSLFLLIPQLVLNIVKFYFWKSKETNFMGLNCDYTEINWCLSSMNLGICSCCSNKIAAIVLRLHEYKSYISAIEKVLLEILM